MLSFLAHLILWKLVYFQISCRYETSLTLYDVKYRTYDCFAYEQSLQRIELKCKLAVYSNWSMQVSNPSPSFIVLDSFADRNIRDSTLLKSNASYSYKLSRI